MPRNNFYLHMGIMSQTKSRFIFFKKIEQNYAGMVYSIVKLIEQGEHSHTSHLEINFVLKLIAKLRLDFNQNSVFTSDILDELLKGGHLKFKDDGLFYTELTYAFGENIQERYSSHNSCVTQYSFSGPIVKEVLFGISVDNDGNKTTWIQFEKHNTKTIIELILHIFDYIMHKWTGQNIGPYGSSDYTENNPLVVCPQ